ncbi:MAG: cobyrinic acid a,c-diamide synthase [Cyanobium sp. NAT70]|nr:cobyrinic acid a,c-diamide synthase [Cyanobium sp. NAT70]
MAVVIAAPASGSGKTLLSLALVAWARTQGFSIQPFKVGPDYLDPQLLSAAAERPCRNLDINLCGEAWVSKAFHGYGGSAELALVEGVMGLFDGIGSSETGSTAATARWLDLPVVLVVDAGGQAASIGALVRGFRDHDPQLRLAGVVLNRVSSTRHRDLLADVLQRLGMPLLGCLPRTDALKVPSRHLGLAPAHELAEPTQRFRRWAALAEAHLDLEQWQPLLKAPTATADPLSDCPKALSPARPIAVAVDQAFHFRYPETGELLERMGMPLLPWSPLADEVLPKEACGVLLPGGFPEQHAEQLSHCHRSLNALQEFAGMHPIYAECGGMLLLGQSLSDLEGRVHRMTGLLPFHARKGHLQVGYRTLRPHRDGLLVRRGESLRGHEFHRWQLSEQRRTHDDKTLWDIEGWRTKQQSEGWGYRRIHASWIHLHWASCSTICCRWRDAIATTVMPSPGHL